MRASNPRSVAAIRACAPDTADTLPTSSASTRKRSLCCTVYTISSPSSKGCGVTVVVEASEK